MKHKKGDTLIEVTLAVGIFSMVAIAIVAVMSGGTSSAQAALETTLTREEIDTQAEALRFIHSSYVASKDSNNKDNSSIKLWRAIENRAIDFTKTGISEDTKATITTFAPDSCQELYNATADNIYAYNANAFIINPRALGGSLGDALIPFSTGSSGKFRQASTYPRIIYGNDNGSLSSDQSASAFNSAEGIYILAVKDENTTSIYNTDPTKAAATSKTAAFYDFYIRTCWYGTDADEPSTISTVIRLYDPAAMK